MNFKEKCNSIVRRIPRGRIMTYKQVADKLGSRAYRAVGSAMSKNKDRSVFCHRVICSNGELGGFNRGRGEKIRLLRSEGVEVVDGKINLDKFSLLPAL
jgi:methylated-DNA-[protein]-cysteine S-methyltransferase